jgi:hypothetical protein
MKKGFLSSYFKEIAVKRLSAVETDTNRSNQHEFNGVSELKKIFGESKNRFDTTFLFICDDAGQYISTNGHVTWYDAREKHLTRSEYRLYYSSNDVTSRMKQGDLLIFGKTANDEIISISVEKETTIESQLLWLFGIEKNLSEKFTVKEIDGSSLDMKLNFASRFILEELGIKIRDIAENLLEQMLQKFGNNFPKTSDFSEFARSTVENQDILRANPDDTIVELIDWEEKLFRTFERHIVAKRLKDGFGSSGEDVDGFLQFSLSVQNRRKSRVGHALENHMEFVFTREGVKFSRGKITENKSKPDFIFPSIEKYHDTIFPANLLTMLGVKSTCKDRWRQVLSEAKRIDKKHLFTLEPAISDNQTDEMIANSLQLVIPSKIQETYLPKQQKWLVSLSDFTKTVEKNQLL